MKKNNSLQFFECVPLRRGWSYTGGSRLIMSSNPRDVFLWLETFIVPYLYAFFRLVFGTLYPAYASYKAVRTKNVKEYVSKTQWLLLLLLFVCFSCFLFPSYIFLALSFPLILHTTGTLCNSKRMKKFNPVLRWHNISVLFVLYYIAYKDLRKLHSGVLIFCVILRRTYIFGRWFQPASISI